MHEDDDNVKMFCTKLMFLWEWSRVLSQYVAVTFYPENIVDAATQRHFTGTRRPTTWVSNVRRRSNSVSKRTNVVHIHNHWQSCSARALVVVSDCCTSAADDQGTGGRRDTGGSGVQSFATTTSGAAERSRLPSVKDHDSMYLSVLSSPVEVQHSFIQCMYLSKEINESCIM